MQQPQTDHDNGYLGEILCLLGMGLFNTYDLAKRDAEGNYQITGRVDDAIRIKGVWLEVPKIESVMVRMAVQWKIKVLDYRFESLGGHHPTELPSLTAYCFLPSL